MFEYALCNEMLAGEGLSLGQQARAARDLGYCGLELAPATLGPAPHLMAPEQAAGIRREIEAEGARVTGLHWLLAGYEGASITDPARQAQTCEILLGLIDLCAALGGRVLVHGSPRHRARPGGMADEAITAHLAAFFAPVAAHAEACGVTYCIEPLARAETDVITNVAAAAALVRAVGSPAFRTMIDMSAAGQEEPPVADLIANWLPTGLIGHIHANDSNRGAPGMGHDPFPAILAALCEADWPHPITVEPFRTLIDARVTAATGIATLRACEEAARWS